MGLSYKKLWHILLDKDMVKRDLREGCGLSTASMAKLSKGRNVNTDILVKICYYLKCDISDICEIVYDVNDIDETNTSSYAVNSKINFHKQDEKIP
jgi:DNA-binding Xre family transcriptional regulator